MIPIFICEDEKNILDYLVSEIKKAILIHGYSMQIKASETNPERLLDECMNGEARGIYFLDVNLKNETYNGFTLAKEIRRIDPRGYIVFVTTHGELVFETFKYKLEAMDYILKDDYEGIGVRIAECLAQVQEHILQEKSCENMYYTVKVFDDIYTIPIQKILYFETSTQEHRIILHTDDMILEYYDNLQNIETELGDEFFRAHRSFLVNRKRVKAIYLKENTIELDNKEVCPISRKAKRIVKEELL